jgi:transcriptional regulator GlxA family with amidase domain
LPLKCSRRCGKIICRDKMNFGFLLFPGLEELDLVGPWEMAGMWSKYGRGPEHLLMIAEKKAPVLCSNGMSLNPHTDFTGCPDLDYLLIPGGEGTRTEVDNPVLMKFVTNRAFSCRAMLSVCTGSFILQRAGLLAGKRATTHWTSLERMRESGDVEVIEERVVQDGSIWTSSGVRPASTSCWHS